MLKGNVNACLGLEMILVLYLTNIVWPQPAAKPHTAIHLLPSNGTGERIRTVKVRKSTGWVKDGGVSKIKDTSSRKAKQRINLLLPINRKVFSWESQAPSCVTVAWEHNANARMPILLLLLFLPILCAERDATRCVVYLWSVGISCPSCIFSQFLVHPQPIWGWSGVKSSKGLGTAQALPSNNENTPVSPTLFSVQIQNIAPYQLLWSKWTLSLTKPVHLMM